MIHFTDNRDINSLLNSVLGEVKTFTEKQYSHIKKLNEIGIALSAENDLDNLLYMILHQAKKFTNADGGTLYLKSDDGKNLSFKVVETDSLDIRMGSTFEEITWPPLNLYLDEGRENRQMVATYCALTGEIINIDDVYNIKGFNFEGTKKFDAGTNYRSKSMLVIPMRNYEGEIIGVLQLLNRLDKYGNKISFTKEDKDLTLSLASQAAVSITNAKLVSDLEGLLNAIIKTIATAIDEKSPYTGGHIKRVAKVAIMLANAVDKSEKSIYKPIKYNKKEIEEIRISAWMHDIGKITTPEHIMDKSTKLETIFDKIELVESRFEIIRRDLKINYLTKKMKFQEENDSEKLELLEKKYRTELKHLSDDLEFIKEANIGSEFMSDDKIARVKEIGARKFVLGSKKAFLLTEDEVKNLCIRKGTLNDYERDKINEHADVTIKMLNQLPFPKKLSRVPEIAGGHHEKINGKGYPLGLCGSELSLEARILAIADVFEALTAPDRPYKDPKKLSEVAKILGFMVKDEELDEDLVRLFFEENLHLEYGEGELREEQLDEVNLNF